MTNLRILTIILTLFSLMSCNTSKDTTSTVHIVHTTDVHGNFLPYNYITRSPWEGSLARAAAWVDSLRSAAGADNVLLLDAGDILQGQPTAYYYNYIDTVSPHVAADIYRYMGYDAIDLGNHDIETGHAVYDRFVSQLDCPVLGANVIDTATGQPYLKPYAVFEKGGLKIAVLGLLTPAIPAWLPENLWSGLRFDDMVETAAKWAPIIIEREKPDLLIGLFHSGHDATTRTGGIMENASEEVARTVAGFDIILIGHDHQRYNKTIQGPGNKPVAIVNPANNANAVTDVAVTVKRNADGQIVDMTTKVDLADIATIEPDPEFMARFKPQADAVGAFVDRKIGVATGDFTTRDAYFGPSAFMSLLHRLQLEISGADISLAAPLSFDARIDKGDIHVSDMFTLYKYENLLYTMELTGSEIKDYLEMAYNLWTQQVDPADPRHLIRFASDDPAPGDNRLKYPSYNFDSAAGINYTVDITKPKGRRIKIESMADGTPFDPARRYRVAVNSYRGNGGGDLLVKGAGIPADRLKERIVGATEKDLRYYLLQAIESRGTITPEVDANWRFIPEATAAKAIRNDSILLFTGPTTHQK